MCETGRLQFASLTAAFEERSSTSQREVLTAKQVSLSEIKFENVTCESPGGFLGKIGTSAVLKSPVRNVQGEAV